MNKNSLVAIDLAKNTFQVCLLGEHYNLIKNIKLSRAKVLDFVLQHNPKVVSMEACYSANYWGRLFQQHGYQVQLVPAQHVKPFVRGNKNDKNDALAIAEACQRPNIRFVPIKSIEQQDIQSLHRIRERLLTARLRLSNQVRGLLSEYGIIFPLGNRAFRARLAELVDQDSSLIGPIFKGELTELFGEYCQYQDRLGQIDRHIQSVATENETNQLLMSIPGIGPTIATAITSTVGQGNQFKSANEFAVWLGLTPRQKASGDKSYHTGITKRGDCYLRKQLIHGARSTLRWAYRRDDPLSLWANQLKVRRGVNKAAVAMAHKLARIAWSVMHHHQAFKLKEFNGK